MWKSFMFHKCLLTDVGKSVQKTVRRNNDKQNIALSKINGKGYQCLHFIGCFLDESGLARWPTDVLPPPVLEENLWGQVATVAKYFCRSEVLPDTKKTGSMHWCQTAKMPHWPHSSWSTVILLREGALLFSHWLSLSLMLAPCIKDTFERMRVNRLTSTWQASIKCRLQQHKQLTSWKQAQAPITCFTCNNSSISTSAFGCFISSRNKRPQYNYVNSYPLITHMVLNIATCLGLFLLKAVSCFHVYLSLLAKTNWKGWLS